ncbi:MAG: cadherin-like domain-containing protein, partial [Polyangiales bacterium]
VAASADFTGAANLEGDWQLEFTTGVIESETALSLQVQDLWRGLLTTQTLDWDVVDWPAPSPAPNLGPNSYVVGGTNVTVQIQSTLIGGSGTTINNSSPDDLTNDQGGLAVAQEGLYISSSGFTAGESVTVSLLFAHPGGVSNVSFTIFDLDTGGFVDEVQASFTAIGAASLVITPSANNTLAAPDTVQGTNNAPSSGPNSGNANATFTFTGNGITRIDLNYRNQGNSSNQSITLHDITFDPTPTASNQSVSVNEDSVHTFSTANFGFSDVGGDTLQQVRITSLETAGALQLNGIDVTLNQVILAADLGLLTFAPDANATGSPYATFRFQVSDGASYSVSDYQMTVNVIPANDPPTLSASLTSQAYIDTAADDTFSPVTGTLSATDRDSGQTLTYDTTGSVADAALAGYDRSRTGTYGTLYVNSTSGAYTFVPSDAPIEALTANASEAFTLSVTDSIATLTQAFSVNLTGTNDTPIVMTSGTTLPYVENDPATIVDGALTIVDVDSVNLVGATTQILAGAYQPGQDILGYDGSLLPVGVTASWNAATGTLSFSGSTTVLQYEALLRSVTYQNTSDNPSAALRTVGFMADDGAGLSAPGTSGISVTPANDAPVLTVNRLTLSDGQTITLTLADLDATDIDNPSANLAFTVTGIQHGHFELASAPGATITTFTYNQLAAGSVRFVHAGGNQVPTYVVTPSDLGLVGTTVAAQITFAPGSDPNDGNALLKPRDSVADDALTVLAPPDTRSFVGSSLGFHAVNAPISIPRGLETFDVLAAPAEPVPVAPSRTTGFAKTDPKVETESMEVLRLPGPVVHMELGNLEFDGPQSRSNIEVLLGMVKMGGLALSVGAVWWATRAAGLIASALSSLPAWRNFDPLPVLGRDEFEEDDWVQEHDRNATAESEEEERLVERRFSNEETQPINLEELRKAISQK